MTSRREHSGARGSCGMGLGPLGIASPFVLVGLLCPAPAAGQDAPPIEHDARKMVADTARDIAGPPPGAGPVVVAIDFELRDVGDIDDEDETFEFRGILTARWHDPRQAFDPRRAFEPGQTGLPEKVYQGHYRFTEVYTGWFPQLVLRNEAGVYETRGVSLRVRPDGDLTLVQMIEATADAELSLRRYPYDTQTIEAVFEVLGAASDEVVLTVDEQSTRRVPGSIHAPQWDLTGLDLEVRTIEGGVAGRSAPSSAFVVRMNVERESFFMVRLVMLPLALIVLLGFSVFWMPRELLGDRLNISFVCILTAVAYQMVVSDFMPRISYVTLMNGVLNLSFLVMGLTVISNLRGGRLEAAGALAEAERVDRRSRWLYPAVYFGLFAVILVIAFTVF